VFDYFYLNITYYEYNFAASNCLHLVKENILSTNIVLEFCKMRTIVENNKDATVQ